MVFEGVLGTRAPREHRCSCVVAPTPAAGAARCRPCLGTAGPRNNSRLLGCACRGSPGQRFVPPCPSGAGDPRAAGREGDAVMLVDAHEAYSGAHSLVQTTLALEALPCAKVHLPSPADPSSHQDALSSKTEPLRPPGTGGRSWTLLGTSCRAPGSPRNIFPLPKDCSTGARLCKCCKVASDHSRHSEALSAGE